MTHFICHAVVRIELADALQIIGLKTGLLRKFVPGCFIGWFMHPLHRRRETRCFPVRQDTGIGSQESIFHRSLSKHKLHTRTNHMYIMIFPMFSGRQQYFVLPVCPPGIFQLKFYSKPFPVLQCHIENVRNNYWIQIFLLRIIYDFLQGITIIVFVLVIRDFKTCILATIEEAHCTIKGDRHGNNHLEQFIGTFFLVLVIGLTATSSPSLVLRTACHRHNINGYGVCWGVLISGGHYNPAVTLAVWMRGKCETKDLVPYWIAQVLPAVIAASAVNFFKSNSVG